MSTSRRHRLITVLVSLCALLFAQVALANYVCPGAAKAAQVAEMIEANLPCAESMSQSMDDAQPGLCQAHCQSDQQATYNYQIPSLATLAQLGVMLTIAVPVAQSGESFLRDPVLQRRTTPPLAVLHCRFRI